MSKARHPYLIQCYGGYHSDQRVLLKGRVLENENFLEEPSDSKWSNLLDSFRRFESDEIPGAKVRVSLLDQQWELTADEEGYFVLDVAVVIPAEQLQAPMTAKVELLFPSFNEPLQVEKELHGVAPRAQFGVISDIDDTVLQTHMNSRMRLRMIYVSFLQGAHQRMPMEGMVELYQDLAGKDSAANPFFYVSNSPWNIHDVLSDFLTRQELPAGPVLLRDFGWHLVFKRKDAKVHKLETIRHILETYPSLPFILFGDTASSDADYYLQFKNDYADQIRAVYIRHTEDTKNARRVKEMVDKNADPNFVLIHSAKQIREHAQKLGLLTA